MMIHFKERISLQDQLWLYKTSKIKFNNKFSHRLKEKIFDRFIGYENEF